MPKRMSLDLTERQAAVLAFMQCNAVTVYPTVREIAKHFGIYPATVHDHILALERKGYVQRTGKQQRRKVG